MQFPIQTLYILWKLQRAGFEGYIVGGSVRDLLLHSKFPEEYPLNSEMDFDFTTNATPEQILATLPNAFYENDFGTVSITPEHLIELMATDGLTVNQEEHVTSHNLAKTINLAEATKIHASLQDDQSLSQPTAAKKEPDFQITTYRSEGRYSDHRRPESVSWGDTIEDDLSRRDFTINAMAVQVDVAQLNEIFSSPTLPSTVTLADALYVLIDRFHGQKDLTNYIIRTVGEPAARFEEDALRMLRAIRFSVQLNMQLTDETFAAIAGLAENIQHISWERIRDEFLKMLASRYPAEAIELLDQTGLLKFILPELLEGKGVDQGGHHTTDVWIHSLDALRTCPSKDPIVRFATLLHDIAKPRTFKLVDGKITFYNHEIVGSRVARDIARRFRLSTTDIDRIFVLVRYHMFYYQPENTDAAIRRFMRKVGLHNMNDILDLREGDRLGSGARKTSWRLEEMKQRMVSQLHQPFAITDLAINGTDLMTALQLQPGPEIGRILKELFEVVMDNPEKNTRDQLLAIAQTLKN